MIGWQVHADFPIWCAGWSENVLDPSQGLIGLIGRCMLTSSSGVQDRRQSVLEPFQAQQMTCCFMLTVVNGVHVGFQIVQEPF